MKKLFILGIIVLSCLFSSCQVIEDYNTYTAVIKCANFRDQNMSIKARTGYRPASINQLKKIVSPSNGEIEPVIEITWVPGKVYIDPDGFVSSFKIKLEYYNEDGSIIPDIDGDDKSFYFSANADQHLLLAFADVKLPKEIHLDDLNEQQKEIDFENSEIINEIYNRDYSYNDEIVYEMKKYFYSWQEGKLLAIKENIKQIENLFGEKELLEQNNRTEIFYLISN